MHLGLNVTIKMRQKQNVVSKNGLDLSKTDALRGIILKKESVLFKLLFMGWDRKSKKM
ncbi:hypothetical protein [Flavobacterium sp.]|uniref:hypothetical protein n=1 Tax=Flavobacterium sp. TaxID=239 RepID=UPI002617E6D5|nr:hypothetical protein [Flavobacterium sp.]